LVVWSFGRLVVWWVASPTPLKNSNFCRTGVFGSNSEYDHLKFLSLILNSLITALTTSSFDSSGKCRLVKFAESLPDAAMVSTLSTLSTPLSWSQMVATVALKTPQARQFYTSQAATNTCSVLARRDVLLEGGDDE
jgi:hypothetical protein